MNVFTNTTIPEFAWVVASAVGTWVTLQLWLRARADMKLVESTKTNGARLLTARQIRRRYFVIFLQIGLFLLGALLTAYLPTPFPTELRGVIPVLLTSIIILIVINAVADTRDRDRIVDYITRLEARALRGERP